MKAAIVLIALALTACATKPKPDVVIKDRIVTVNKPVATPCVGKRPDEPVPLAQRYSDAEWAAMKTFDRWRDIGRNAIAWAGYGETMNTETSACE